jgi:hypothetical protein
MDVGEDEHRAIHYAVPGRSAAMTRLLMQQSLTQAKESIRIAMPQPP